MSDEEVAVTMDQEEALERLSEICEEMRELAGEAKTLGRTIDSFVHARAEAYNAYATVSSPNPHDITLDTIVEEFEQALFG